MYIYIYIYVYIYIYNIYIYVCACIYIYIYTCVCARVRASTSTYIRTCTHTYLSIYLPTYLHTYIHTYIHAYIHIYIYIYIYMYECVEIRVLLILILFHSPQLQRGNRQATVRWSQFCVSRVSVSAAWHDILCWKGALELQVFSHLFLSYFVIISSQPR